MGNLRASLLVVGTLVSAASWSTGVASGDVIEIVASRDVTLYESSAGNIANGSGQYLFAGYTLRNSSRYRRSLLRFDVAAIPAGAIVTDATLRMSMSQTISGDVSVSLHRVTRNWSEGPSSPGGNEGSGTDALAGDSTWLHTNYPGATWTTAGGDFVAVPVAETTVGATGFYVWSSNASMVNAVLAWRADPSQNFGLLVKGDEANNGSSKRFDSREHPDPTHRPTLIVTYTLCAADFNGDGFLDFTDFDAFVEGFEAGTAAADFNADGFLDFTDFDAFVTAFEAGC
ncbi:MAG: DNRLRE domain-containing protein [Planctomycetota bacterium]|nr:DNRLRE domain-containing protein [Planctomycetota bacterium]